MGHLNINVLLVGKGSIDSGVNIFFRSFFTFFILFPLFLVIIFPLIYQVGINSYVIIVYVLCYFIVQYIHCSQTP